MERDYQDMHEASAFAPNLRHEGSENSRRAERLALVLPGRCRTIGGIAENVVIHDLSAFGCRIAAGSLAVQPGARVIVKPGTMEGLTGTVRWVGRQVAGIEFEQPLYAPLVDHLHRTYRTFLKASGARLVASGLRLMG